MFKNPSFIKKQKHPQFDLIESKQLEMNFNSNDFNPSDLHQTSSFDLQFEVTENQNSTNQIHKANAIHGRVLQSANEPFVEVNLSKNLLFFGAFNLGNYKLTFNSYEFSFANNINYNQSTYNFKVPYNSNNLYRLIVIKDIPRSVMKMTIDFELLQVVKHRRRSHTWVMGYC